MDLVKGDRMSRVTFGVLLPDGRLKELSEYDPIADGSKIYNEEMTIASVKKYIKQTEFGIILHENGKDLFIPFKELI